MRTGLKLLIMTLFILNCSVIGSAIGSANHLNSEFNQMMSTELNSQYRVKIQYPDSIYEEYRFVNYDSNKEQLTVKHLLNKKNKR
jgi:hypothetical protein